jgi:hypothetical protein
MNAERILEPQIQQLRACLYPFIKPKKTNTRFAIVVRLPGFEPESTAWEAAVLPN